MKTLPQMLEDWCDLDVTMIAIAQGLGLVDEEKDDCVGLVYISNPVGNLLVVVIDYLVQFGALEKGENGDVYRWNKLYSWPIAFSTSRKQSGVYRGLHQILIHAPED